MDYRDEAMKMRASAWADLAQTDAFKVFRAADNMVVELGGESIMPDLSAVGEAKAINPAPRIRSVSVPAGPTQGDAAVKVLTDGGRPQRIMSLLTGSKAIGAKAGGANPLANFRSALSKDDRLFSFRRNGEYWWWLSDEPLPEGWGEAADDLPFDTAASVSNNQEGGDGHAANNT